jgi:hypothetical protein
MFHAQLTTQHYDAVGIKPCCWDKPVPITLTLGTKREKAAIPFLDGLAFFEQPLGG